MQTKDLCLATLQLGEASGYDIKTLFENAFRHFQRVSYGSIYPALNDLAKAGMVECRVDTPANGPEKKLYSLTTLGEERFFETINNTPPSDSYQSDFLVLILFSRWIRRDRLATIMDDYRDNLEHEALELKRLLANKENCLSTEARFTINFGLSALGAKIRFLEENADDLLLHHQEQTKLENQP